MRSLPDVTIRPACPDDVEGIFHVRTSVTENVLTPADLSALGITPAVIRDMIISAPCAWVAVDQSEIVGFSMIDLSEACLFAAFVLPAHESRGIGKRLVRLAEGALFAHHPHLWLETSASSRAASFYRHLGWGNETDVGRGDIRLEKSRD